ncbi:MAG: TIGR03087 family PEP-CTERM/XrtA system glycosyltransferase [Sphingopyxis sp.]
MGEILYLAHRAPWPPDRGDRIRSWHIVRALAGIAPVHIASLADNAADRDIAQPKLDSIAASSHIALRDASRVGAALSALPRLRPLSLGLFASAALHAHVRHLLATRPITHIVAFSSQMAQYVPADFAGRFIMDFVDVDSAKFTQYAGKDSLLSPWRYIHSYEGARLAAWEMAVARRADLSLLVSEAEASLLRHNTGLGADVVRALDNGIDLDRFTPNGDWPAAPHVDGPALVFTGQMDYRPNIEAVSHFARDIMPIIRAGGATAGPTANAQFLIVGRAPTDEVRALAALPGVVVTGEVPDTRPYLQQAAVVVAPLAVARGVQNKLLEAMGVGCAVVASPAAAEGIDAADGHALMVADDAAATAAACAALINDPARARAMGAAARDRMVARYGWDAVLAPLAGMLGMAQMPGG